MAKFCGNCGSSAEDYARVCGNCGTPFEDAGMAEMAPGVGGEGKKNMLKKLMIAGIAAVIAIILVVVGVNVVKNNTGTNALVKNYAKAYETGNTSNKFVDAFITADEEELLPYFEEMSGEIEDEIGEYKVSYEIKKEKEIKNSELKEIEENIEWAQENDLYEDIDVDDIKEGKKVTVKYTFKGDDDTAKLTETITFLKVGSKWMVYAVEKEKADLDCMW